ncbi:group I truncated hemoglobin [Pseudomaricurvus sp.]|uniref:group I truncated hemoglobin n=1 Tax=Pseudomaricurvus sp. TaxID=2004510 RepID=UPI003F6C4940
MRRIRFSFFIVSLLLALLSCSSQPQQNHTLYQALGASEGVETIVYDLIVRIAKDDRVVERFRHVDIMRFKSGLETYICAVTDGPCDYNGDSIRIIHAGHHYTDTEFNTIVELLIESMEAAEIPTATQNRLLALLAKDYSDVVYH